MSDSFDAPCASIQIHKEGLKLLERAKRALMDWRYATGA